MLNASVSGGLTMIQRAKPVVQHRADEHRRGDQVARLAHELREAGVGVALRQRAVDPLHVDHLRVVEDLVHQRLLGAQRGQHREADERRHRPVLHRKPEAVELQQAEAARA
ncbi:MAG: hypothetical protein WDM96_02290 [Lacunisphaera sp.]